MRRFHADIDTRRLPRSGCMAMSRTGTRQRSCFGAMIEQAQIHLHPDDLPQTALVDDSNWYRSKAAPR